MNSGALNIFVTGGTGYIGARLVERLIRLGHNVTVLVRKGSESKVVTGATAVVADPFDSSTFENAVPARSTFVQLLGVSHPSPKKEEQFKTIDLRSVRASADAAAYAAVSHFVYVSVAMSPSKFMHAYQDVRRQGEEYCLNKNLTCTFIRPWYVLGPGHRWPLLLLPLYGVAELIPGWRDKARAMGLVTIRQMTDTLVHAIENTPTFNRIIEIPGIRDNRSLNWSELKTLRQEAS